MRGGLATFAAYGSKARALSGFWKRPLPEILGKMLLGRVLHGRGPAEFDEYRFATKPVREWRRYVNEDERRRLQEAASPVEHRTIEEDKLRFWHRCEGAGLPTIPITVVLRTDPESVIGPNVPVARTAEELAERVEGLQGFDGFAKPLTGGQGYGAFSFRIADERVTHPGGETSIEDFFRYCVSLRFATDGYLLQPRIRAHPGLLDVMPGPGLGTIRIVTFLGPDGSLEVPWAVLKIPGPGRMVCNPRLGALMLPVELGSGRLGPAVGPTADVDVVHEVTSHPSTGVRFEDVVVPEWQSVLDWVERAAREFSELPALGWDVAVTETGPMLIEANWAFGIYTQQIAYDRGLRAELEACYERCAPSEDRP